MERNVVGWFEIPVENMDRAILFYQSVFGYEFHRPQAEFHFEMAWFPYDDVPGSPGALVRHKDFYRPSTDGVLIYFTSPSGDLQNELDKVELAGGKVILSKKMIAEDIGYMGLFLDTEGNRIAIHSRS